jgi:hypothetical protein
MKKILVAAALTLVSATAFAESVKEKKAWDKIAEESKEASAKIKEKCGVDMTISVDKKSWNTVELAEGPARWCIDGAESAIAGLCGDADYKAAVAKQLKTVTCIHDGSLKTDSAANYGNKLTMAGTAVEWRYNKDSANMSEKMRDFLKEKL